MANYSEQNNNHVPTGFSPEMAASTFAQFQRASPHHMCRSPPHFMSTFTFTAPTQCNTIASPLPSIQSYSGGGLGNSLMAPGLGATWQHSVPTPSTWTFQAMGGGGGGSRPVVFTGVPHLVEFQPSCSNIVRRPKRKAMESLDDGPRSKVYLCTDQLANLQITSTSSSSLSSSSSIEDGSSAPASTMCQDRRGWDRFRQLEDSLDLASEEDSTTAAAATTAATKNDDDNTTSDSKSGGPVLKVHDCVLNESKEPILPQKVLDHITKPCMEVVLWQSPGALIRDVIGPPAEKEQESNTSTKSSSNSRSSKATTTGLVTAPSDITMEEPTTIIPSESSALSAQATVRANQPENSKPLVVLNYQQTPIGNFDSLGQQSRVVRTSTSNSNLLEDLDMFEGMDDDMLL